MNKLIGKKKKEEKHCQALHFLREKKKERVKMQVNTTLFSGPISVLSSTAPGSFEEKVKCLGQI